MIRGGIYLCQFDYPDKQRPVLVLTRDSAISYLSRVTVAPVSSTIRGVPSEVILDVDDGMKAPCSVNLFNAITLPQSRLGRRLASLNADRMHEVCSAVRFAFGCP
ncbi:MAG: type II toxin-antitoxin system PemK/MazF family toxin [Candidatus Solibacter usitatus]|nr:type II toxin-antitoxin system PemK/MazF family toxin [Candidatus Solibacter usitatus]